MNINFSMYKSAPKNCKHENVELRSVHPITKQPKKGVCKDCGKWLKAKIIWEEIKI